jgi:hypothetical protein
MCGNDIFCYCGQNKRTEQNSKLNGRLVGREFDRLIFLIRRDGLEKAKEFAKRGVVSYRKHVLSKKSLIHRKKFIESYLAFKRFAN